MEFINTKHRLPAEHRKNSWDVCEHIPEVISGSIAVSPRNEYNAPRLT